MIGLAEGVGDRGRPESLWARTVANAPRAWRKTVCGPPGGSEHREGEMECSGKVRAG